MERLTTRLDDGRVTYADAFPRGNGVIAYDDWKQERRREAVNRLADYEEAEEQGHIKRCPKCGSLEMEYCGSEWDFGMRYDDYKCVNCSHIDKGFP
jgi:DNA-directed RNA polymerase subunit RPC12/RpoP